MGSRWFKIGAGIEEKPQGFFPLHLSFHKLSYVPCEGHRFLFIIIHTLTINQPLSKMKENRITVVFFFTFNYSTLKRKGKPSGASFFTLGEPEQKINKSIVCCSKWKQFLLPTMHTLISCVDSRGFNSRARVHRQQQRKSRITEVNTKAAMFVSFPDEIYD